MKKKFKILGLTLSACMAFGLAALASGCSAKDKTDKWFEQLFCEHKYDEGVETQAPTCTEEGVLTYTCTECGKTKKKDIAMIEHTEVEIPSVSPTCTEVGYTAGVKCAVCEEVLQQPKVVAKIAHFEVLDSEAVAATCTTAGLKPGTHCARCDEVITEETVIPALGHLEVPDTAVEATCTTSGLTEGKHCKRCNEVLEAQEIIPATGHIDENDDGNCDTCGFSFVLQLDDIEVGTDLTGYKFRLKVSEDEFKQYVFSEEYKNNSLIIRFNPDTSFGESSGACDNRIYNNKEDGIMLMAWYDVFDVFLFLSGDYDEESFGVIESNPIPAGLGPVIEIETGDWSRYVELYYVG